MAENKKSVFKSLKRNSLQNWAVVCLHKNLHPFGVCYCGPCSQIVDPRANDLLQCSNELLMLASALGANT